LHSNCVICSELNLKLLGLALSIWSTVRDVICPQSSLKTGCKLIENFLVKICSVELMTRQDPIDQDNRSDVPKTVNIDFSEAIISLGRVVTISFAQLILNLDLHSERSNSRPWW
jgi:hypothetical protein